MQKKQSSWYIIHVVSPDTDVFVLLVAFDSTIPANVFMFGANGKIYYISKLSKAIGERKCQALVGFRAFTACDTTGKFKGKGKPTLVKLFMDATEDTIDAFCKLGQEVPVKVLFAKRIVLKGIPKCQNIFMYYNTS